MGLVSLASGCAERTEFDESSYVAGEPQHGGTLNVATVSHTLSALSFDPEDWSWKSNQDTGAVREQLFAGDLDQSLRRGGRFDFTSDAYLSPDAIRGELARSWEWEAPLTLVVHLRQGVMFTERPGIMARRELTAADVVFTYELLKSSPKMISGYFDHIDSVTPRDDHSVVFTFNEYNAEWAYRFGYGYFSGIVPPETADLNRKDWRNVVGTGPFKIGEYVHGNSQVHLRNPDYWDTETIDGRAFDIPFVDRLVYRIIKDEATVLTALRTGKLDVLEAVRWSAVDHLRETTPELQWNRWLATAGNFMALRVDQAPLDDHRVRRALNLAVNQPEIVERYYGGHAELMAFPQHPAFGDYYQPLEDMPESVQELFTYDPEKAKRLLVEAGYPDGFEMEVQVSNTGGMELVPLLVDYLSRVGVRLLIRPMEYASYLSIMTTRTHGPGYFMSYGHVNPTTTLRKNFVTGQRNPSMYSDPAFDLRMDEVFRTRDESERIRMVRELTVEILDAAPYVWLPTSYAYTAWWPWVRNYGGELRVGAERPGPIHARVWIDQALKRELGF